MDATDRLKPAGEASNQGSALVDAARKARQAAESQKSGKESAARPLPAAGRPGMR